MISNITGSTLADEPDLQVPIQPTVQLKQEDVKADRLCDKEKPTVDKCRYKRRLGDGVSQLSLGKSNEQVANMWKNHVITNCGQLKARHPVALPKTGFTRSIFSRKSSEAYQ